MWESVSPLGSLYSWTEVHHRFDPSGEVPYVVALVEFKDAPGVRLITNLIDVGGVGDLALSIDMPVEPCFPTNPAPQGGGGDSRIFFRPA